MYFMFYILDRGVFVLMLKDLLGKSIGIFLNAKAKQRAEFWFN